MAREFDKNIFVMLLSIMIGVIIITYFVADIQNRAQREKLITKHSEEIKTIESKNINFTNSFIQSLGLIDLARGYRSDGNYNFDLGKIWYNSALSETNVTEFETYKNRVFDNCDNAVSNYTNSYNNFLEAKDRFEFTKPYTNYDGYLKIIDLYINLSTSGSRLVSYRMNSSIYLKYLTENLTIENDTVCFKGNVSSLMDLYNTSLDDYLTEEQLYSEIEGQIEREYDIIGFSEIREEG